jgi:ELWxxDGT repeat protein
MKKLLPFLLLLGFLTAGAQHFTLIKDINPGSSTSNICYLTNVNGKLFFAANDGVNGMELWKSDGTTAGTILVKDINTGSSSSSLGYLTSINSTLFFVANDGVTGTELWKSDGTTAGTVLVKDISPGTSGSNPSSLVNVNGSLFFAADNGSNGTELWKSDGTVAGTVLVKDINPAVLSSYPQSLANANGVLFFAADNGSNGMELWKSDGTAAGTVLVKDIWPGNSDSYPFELIAIGSKLYFSASDGNAGTELWKSDGTTAGTTLLKDIWNGNSDAYPFGLVNVQGTLFFSADNGSNGIELWKSDGTSTGTTLVKDVWPGQESGAAGNFSRFINKLIFTGNDGLSGYKTWQSDGTSGGTKIATGIADPGDGDMGELVETDTKIFAGIRHDDTGSELWAINFSIVLPLDLLEFKGELVQQDALLSWKTANELNTSEFILERSINGNDFEAMGRIAAVNNNSGNHDYQYTDASIRLLKTDKVYYRLKQVDIDSRFTYSKVVAISLKNQQEFNIYPNPAVNTLNVATGVPVAGALQYRIFDNNGKMILQDSKKASTSYLSINISTLSSGIYHLELQFNGISKVVQFVKR